MSEWLHKENPHMENLRKYCQGLLEDGDLRELFVTYEKDIYSVRDEEVISLVDWMVAEGYDLEDIKDALNKILNIFYNSLDDNYDENMRMPLFIQILMDENEEFTNRLNNIKEYLVNFSKSDRNTEEFNKLRLKLKNLIAELSEFESHYVKKENILFPYVEKFIPEHGCLQVMWSIHDDIRKGIKEVVEILENEYFDDVEFNRAIGRLYFDAFGMIFRENLILYPVAVRMIPEEKFIDMVLQCPELGYSYIEEPDLSDIKPVVDDIPEGMVNLGTGELTLEQLILMLNNLPVDITFVDENDNVRYFSSPKDRIFPRSKAIIGRNVQNCHPPESLHIVNEVVKRLKSGEKDVESFWIEMGGKFILIQYFALRNDSGEFKGIIEVSQDISYARSLKDEKRLLDFE
jgi:PAS domain S-box-containing protein